MRLGLEAENIYLHGDDVPISCYVLFGRAGDIRMEGVELGMVETQKTREVPERTGFQGKPVQIFGWRLER